MLPGHTKPAGLLYVQRTLSVDVRYGNRALAQQQPETLACLERLDSMSSDVMLLAPTSFAANHQPQRSLVNWRLIAARRRCNWGARQRSR